MPLSGCPQFEVELAHERRPRAPPGLSTLVSAQSWSPLWRLWDQSRHSFYFAPSLKLWIDSPKYGTQPCDAEVDAIAIVDGTVYLVEAKSAAGIDDDVRGQLVMTAEHIRPDVLVIASMEKSNAALERARRDSRAALPVEIEINLMTFDPEQLQRMPFGLA